MKRPRQWPKPSYQKYFKSFLKLEQIHSDRGKGSVSSIMTTAYHSQGYTVVEEYIDSFITLFTFVNQGMDDWDKVLFKV